MPRIFLGSLMRYTQEQASGQAAHLNIKITNAKAPWM
jgi:hypothetical protein